LIFLIILGEQYMLWSWASRGLTPRWTDWRS
jgi:hypothetical protein